MLPIPTRHISARLKPVPGRWKSRRTYRMETVAGWSRTDGATSGKSRLISGEALSDTQKRRLSMVRSYTVADFFTLGNGTCGTISIFLCLNYIAEGRNRYFWIAFILLFVALFCDIFDGYWARRS